MQAAGLLKPGSTERFLMTGYVDALTEDIQTSALARTSGKLGVPMLDLSRRYRDQYGGLPLAQQFALGYFLENVEDNAHFGYRGNAWIADQIFDGFLDRFGALARAHRRAPRPP